LFTNIVRVTLVIGRQWWPENKLSEVVEMNDAIEQALRITAETIRNAQSKHIPTNPNLRTLCEEIVGQYATDSNIVMHLMMIQNAVLESVARQIEHSIKLMEE
jgi:hypothetical protein